MADNIIMEIVERIAYYERRHRNVEEDCRNLETSYNQNDESAMGFLTAIRMQEHWNGEGFNEIARTVLEINPGKICSYIIARSIDAEEAFRDEIFKPELYRQGELEEIARKANSNAVLRKIFSHVKAFIRGGDSRTILGNMATNPVVEEKLFEELYQYDRGIKNQIFINIGCQASTDLLMKMLENDDCQDLHINNMLYYQRPEIYERLSSWGNLTPELMCEFLRYSYDTQDVDSKWVKAVEERLLSDNFSRLRLHENECVLELVMQGTENPELRQKIQKYLKR